VCKFNSSLLFSLFPTFNLMQGTYAIYSIILQIFAVSTAV
jgi:hypothetical protein